MMTSINTASSYTIKIIGTIVGGILVLMLILNNLQEYVNKNRRKGYRNEYDRCINDTEKYIKDKKIPKSELNKHLELYSLRRKQELKEELTKEKQNKLKQLNEYEIYLKELDKEPGNEEKEKEVTFRTLWFFL